MTITYLMAECLCDMKQRYFRKYWVFHRFNTTVTTNRVSIKTVGEKVLIQNIGAADITIGENGFVVNPGGSIELPLASIFDICTNGTASFVVGIFANNDISSIDYLEQKDEEIFFNESVEEW